MITRFFKYSSLCLLLILFTFLSSCSEKNVDDITELPGKLYAESAYEIAASLGYEDSKEEWIALLNINEQREVEFSTNFDSIVWRYVEDSEWKSFIALEQLKDSNGKSAYEIAKEFGFQGDENDWLDSLKGQKGIKGKNVEYKVTLTKIEWRYVDEEKWKQLFDLETLQGKDGLRPYEVYLKFYPDYNKSEEEWINDLMNGNLGYKVQYSVTFNKENGEPTYLSYYDKGSIINEPEVPVKRGYTFDGWYYGNDEERWLFDIYTVETDVTLTAKYVANRYNIEYNYNGGYPSSYMPTSYADPIGDRLREPEAPNEFVVFLGWYLTSDFSGDPIIEIEPLTGKDICLYAKWKTLEVYSITYVLNGGINNPNAPSYYNNEKGVTLPSPTKEGYQFEGWYLTEDFNSTVISKIPANTGKDVTVYAKWLCLDGTYPIYFELNGGTFNCDYPLSYDSSLGLNVLPTPERLNYTFVGWYFDSKLSISASNKLPPGLIGEVYLYAKWEKN